MSITLSASQIADLTGLIEALREGQITSEDAARLDRWIRQEEDARWIYVQYTNLYAGLAWERGTRRDALQQESEAERETHDWDSVQSTTAPDLAGAAIGKLGEWNPEFVVPSASDTILPIPRPFLGNVLHGTVGYFSSGWPVAYLVATVIFGIGLLIGAVTHVSQPVQVAHKSVPLPSPSFTTHYPLSTTHSTVGRITGMVDCQWSDPSTAAFNGASVPLGRKYALASGLIEITYNTGARVILQGPCTYEVESPAGGFLSVGKLTAKLEKGSEVRVQESEASNHKSEILNQKFVVRTPTATVTDLGTEFGVEVDQQGTTTSHVFRGAVTVQLANAGRSREDQPVIVREDHSVRVEKPAATDGDTRITLIRGSAGAERFLRRLPQPRTVPRLQEVAYFRLGEDDPGVAADHSVGERTFSCRRQSLERRGNLTYTTEHVAPGSSLAINFTGADGECLFGSQLAYAINDFFILETWARLNKFQENGYVVYVGDPQENGYGIMVKRGRWYGKYGGMMTIDSDIVCEPGKWTHLAMVCDRGRTQLFVNGRAAGKPYDGIPIMPDGPFVIGTKTERSMMTLNGQIDEVRLSTMLAPFRPEMLLFHSATNPSGVQSTDPQEGRLPTHQ